MNTTNERRRRGGSSEEYTESNCDNANFTARLAVRNGNKPDNQKPTLVAALFNPVAPASKMKGTHEIH